MFALVKRVGEKDENLASQFYSILLSTNLIMLFFFLKFVFPPGLLSKNHLGILLKVFLLAVFVLVYYACKRYFLTKKNYERIIEKYQFQYHNKNKIIALTGAMYALFTFISFLSLAVFLSHIKN